MTENPYNLYFSDLLLHSSPKELLGILNTKINMFRAQQNAFDDAVGELTSVEAPDSH